MPSDPRGDLLDALRGALARGTFVRLVLGKYRGPPGGARQVQVRRVRLRTGDHLSFRHRHATRDETRNVPLGEGADRVGALLEAGYRSAVLFTTEADHHFEVNRRGEARLWREAPTGAAAPIEHDRRKRRVLGPEAARYLEPLGVLDREGRARPRQAHKYRQIEKFLEIMVAAVEAAGLGAGPASRRTLTVVDMGAGKGYLTFAAYDFLRHRLGREVALTALEARSDLAEAGNALAARIGFAGLRFVAGTIEDAPFVGADVVIALHACDTATDDAIYRGVVAGASLILCAPCCHKELRPQIRPPPGLERALRHGIFRERQAELITDALRALLLERSGYAAKVFEFVSTEHTAKNTMIAAVRRGGGDAAAAQAEIERLKAMYGIREQRLETLLARRV